MGSTVSTPIGSLVAVESGAAENEVKGVAKETGAAEGSAAEGGIQHAPNGPGANNGGALFGGGEGAAGVDVVHGAAAGAVARQTGGHRQPARQQLPGGSTY